MRWAFALTAAFIAGMSIYGNDGAASTAAGGIQLKKEARISMEKERLFIGEKTISVEYEFLNQTDRDVSTEVAFPIPPYDYAGIFNGGDNARPIEHFRVWVEGREVAYQSEVKAMLKGIDYSAPLRQLGIDVVSLGHFDDASGDEPFARDFRKLSKLQQNELRRIGLFDEYFPQWTVVMTHHWQQNFPANKILHVRHEYSPAIGEEATVLDDLIKKHTEKRHLVTFAQWCIVPTLQKTLEASMHRTESSFVKWVDYILTTANTWKTPIKQFELIVERPKADTSAKYYYVSFCWDGQILQMDPDHFVVRASNFVPKRELSIAFFPRE